MAVNGHLESSNRISIAELEPSVISQDAFIEGVVTLIWPYSSSDKSFSILLVEADFRLRRHKGQVRVHFTNSSAKAAAKSRISSGDQVRIKLAGAQWEKDETTSSTPGKGIGWELRFCERLVLQILRQSEEPDFLDVNHPSPSPDSRTHSPFTPAATSIFNHIVTPVPLVDDPARAQVWFTPAFLKRGHVLRTSSGPDHDIFDEDVFADNERRKKFKFGRASDQWKFAEHTPSPESEVDFTLNGVNDIAPTELQSPIDDDVQQPSHRQETPLDNHENEATNFNWPWLRQDEGERIERAISEQRMLKSDEPIKAPDEKAALANVAASERQKIPMAATESTLLTTENPEPDKVKDPIDQATTAIASSHEIIDTNQSCAPIDTTFVSERPPSPKLGPQAATEDSFFETNADSGSDRSRAIEHKTFQNLGLDTEYTSRNLNDDRNLPTVKQRKTDSGIEDRDPQVGASFRDIPFDEIEPGHSQAQSSPEVSEATNPGPAIPVRSISPTSSSLRGDLNNEAKSVSLAGQRLAETCQPEDEAHSSPDDDLSPSDSKDTEQNKVAHSQEASTTLKSLLDEVKAKRKIVERKAGDIYEIEPVVRDPWDTSVETSLVDWSTGTEENGSPILNFTEGEVVSSGQHQDRTSDVAELPWTASQPDFDLAIEEGDDVKSDLHRRDRGEMASRGESFSSANDADADQDSGVAEAQSRSSGEEDFSIAEEEREGEDELARDVDQIWVSKGGDAQSNKVPSELSGVEVINLESSDEDREASISQRTASTSPAPRSSHEGESTSRQASLPLQEAETGSDKVHLLNATHVTQHTSLTSYTSQTHFPTMDEDHPLVPQQTTTNTIQTSGKVTTSKDGTCSPAVVISSSLKSSPYLDEARMEYIHIDPRLKNQVLTPNDTQPTEINSQTSSPSLRSEREIHDLPTPHPTQSFTSDNLIPASLRPLPSTVDDGSSPTGQAEVENDSVTRSRFGPSEPVDDAVRFPFAPRKSAEPGLDSRDQSEDDDNRIVRRWKKEDGIKERGSDVSVIEAGRASSPLLPKLVPTMTPTETRPVSPPTGLRTYLSYYAPLSTLRSHFNNSTDTISIVLSYTPTIKATGGPGDFCQSIFVTDPSSQLFSSSQPLTTARIFRHNKAPFPSLHPANVILLRNFNVQSFNRRPSLLSTDSSAWAVFSKTENVQIAGPPVEFGAEERGYVRGLWDWWASLEIHLREGLVKSADEEVEKAKVRTEKEKQKGKGKLKGMGLRLGNGGTRGSVKKGQRRPEESSKHELRDGKTWEDKTGTEKPEEVHALRDGTTYKDRE
ncbi:MAG: hypothetical protein Q9214_002094 [Letrouitia sp. 1 TL-2023]